MASAASVAARARKKARQRQAHVQALQNAPLQPQASSTSVSSLTSTAPGPGTRWIHAPIAQSHPFFRLTEELRTEVLSYLPRQEISSLRKFCQEFYDTVAGSE